MFRIKMSSHKPCEQKLRFLHNVAGGPEVDVYVDGELLASNLAYSVNPPMGELTSYLTVPCKSRHRIVVKVAGTDNLITRDRVKISSDYTSVIIAGSLDGSSPLVLKAFPDYMNKPKYGHSYIRFIQGAAGYPPVNVYINGNRICSGISYGETGYPIYHDYKLTGDIFALVEVKANGMLITASPVYITNRSNLTLFLGGIHKSQEYPSNLVLGYDSVTPGYQYASDRFQKDFSPQNYMNKWNQIGDIPQFYELGCANAVAQYTLLQENVKVYNRCYNMDGELVETILGKATIPNPNYLAALQVEFPFMKRDEGYPLMKSSENMPNGPPFPVIPGGPNYLVHATDYSSYALVGSPARNALYILSREPKMKKRKYYKLLRLAEYLGYDISKVKLNYNTLY